MTFVSTTRVHLTNNINSLLRTYAHRFAPVEPAATMKRPVTNTPYESAYRLINAPKSLTIVKTSMPTRLPSL